MPSSANSNSSNSSDAKRAASADAQDETDSDDDEADDEKAGASLRELDGVLVNRIGSYLKTREEHDKQIGLSFFVFDSQLR